MTLDIRKLALPAVMSLFALGMFVLAQSHHDYVASSPRPHPVKLEGRPMLARDSGKTPQQMAAAATYLPVTQWPEILPKGVYWLKLALRNQASVPMEAMVALPVWDRVTVYDAKGLRVRALAGATVGWKERFEHQSLQVGRLNLYNDPSIIVPGDSVESLLVKLEVGQPHESSSLASIDTWRSPYRARIHFENEAVLSSAFIGALVALAGLAILAFVATLRASYGWYAAHVSCAAVYWATVSGIGYGFLYPDVSYAERIEYCATVAMAATLLLFARSHLGIATPASRMGRFLLGSAIAVALLDGFFSLSSFDMVDLSLVFAYTVALIAGLSAHSSGRRDAQYFVVAILCTSVGYLLYWLGFVSVLDVDAAPLALGASVAEAALLTFSLAMRYRNVNADLMREREKRRETEAILERERLEALEARQRDLEREVHARTAELRSEKARSERLLRNMLPESVAEELKRAGRVRPQRHEDVTILFSDFHGFTNIASTVPAHTLVHELNEIFSAFDEIMLRNGVEKIKTVGDAYVAACGLPDPKPDHAIRCARAACEMISWVQARNSVSAIKWPIRIGLHSGSVVAGVVGNTKYAYDFWGDTVNVAARLESSSNSGRINVSAYTIGLLREHFDSEYRGKIDAKGKGEIDMYFLGAPKSRSPPRDVAPFSGEPNATTQATSSTIGERG